MQYVVFVLKVVNQRLFLFFILISVKSNAELLRGKREESVNAKLSPKPETVVSTSVHLLPMILMVVSGHLFRAMKTPTVSLFLQTQELAHLKRK